MAGGSTVSGEVCHCSRIERRQRRGRPLARVMVRAARRGRVRERRSAAARLTDPVRRLHSAS
eukprot:4230049-Prymnesium_polylepis.1